MLAGVLLEETPHFLQNKISLCHAKLCSIDGYKMCVCWTITGATESPILWTVGLSCSLQSGICSLPPRVPSSMSLSRSSSVLR